MYLDFEDFLVIIVKAFVISIVISLFFFLSSKLVEFNYMLGMGYCDRLNSPYDFCMTVMSCGLALEVAIVTLFIEMILIGYILYKISKIRIISNIIHEYF